MQGTARSEATLQRGPLLHNGEYCVTHPTRGWFASKVYTIPGGEQRGRRVIALMVGAREVCGVAWWFDRDAYALIWEKYRGHDSRLPLDGYHYQKRPGWSAQEQKIAIFLDLALRKIANEARGEVSHSHFEGSGYQIQRTSRCVACNRELSDPSSAELGVGPECVKEYVP